MTSKTTVLLVAAFLGLCAAGGIVAITFLAGDGHSIPASLETLTGTALGALAMTLGSSRSTLTAGDVEPTPLVPQPKVAVDSDEVTVQALTPLVARDAGPMLADLNQPAR